MSKMFSIPGGIMVVAVLCAALSIHYQTGVFETPLWISLGWFCYGKLALAAFFTQGYGVKKGVTIVAGMPMLLAGVFTILAILIACLLMLTYQPSTLLPVTIARIQGFGWSAAIGVAVALCHWYFYARKQYYHQSEYNIRCECKARNDSPEVTEATVARYHECGVIQS